MIVGIICAFSPIHLSKDSSSDTADDCSRLNLVCLDGERYVVDVGMGAWGPNIPYPLQDGYECETIAPRKLRLQYRPIPEHGSLHDADAQRLWCYDVCHHPNPTSPAEETWIPTYCFTDTEFLPQDYEMMSWFTSTNPASVFTYSVLVTKMVMDEAGEKIVGDVTLFGKDVRRTVGGKRELVKGAMGWEERFEVLREVFGVELTEEERGGKSREVDCV